MVESCAKEISTYIYIQTEFSYLATTYILCETQEEKVRMNSHVNANASPEGEKATPCTHPPEGEVNSPQTVFKGKRSPQTVGVGLCVYPAQVSQSVSRILMMDWAAAVPNDKKSDDELNLSSTPFI